MGASHKNKNNNVDKTKTTIVSDMMTQTGPNS